MRRTELALMRRLRHGSSPGGRLGGRISLGECHKRSAISDAEWWEREGRVLSRQKMVVTRLHETPARARSEQVRDGTRRGQRVGSVADRGESNDDACAKVPRADRIARLSSGRSSRSALAAAAPEPARSFRRAVIHARGLPRTRKTRAFLCRRLHALVEPHRSVDRRCQAQALA